MSGLRFTVEFAAPGFASDQARPSGAATRGFYADFARAPAWSPAAPKFMVHRSSPPHCNAG